MRCIGKGIMVKPFNSKRFKKLWAIPTGLRPASQASAAGPDQSRPLYATEMGVESLETTERGPASVKPAKSVSPEAPTASAQPAKSPTPVPPHQQDVRQQNGNPQNGNPQSSPESPDSPDLKNPAPKDNPLNQLVQKWRWPLIWLSALGVLGGMGTAALVWLVSLPPQINCRNPAQLNLDMERLYCAQEEARTGDIAKLIASIDMLKTWEPDHPLYREAQRQIEDWSSQVLDVAVDRVERGDLKGAEAALSHIPPSVPIYKDVQASLGRWRKYSKRATKLYDDAQTALKQKQWDVVSQKIVLLAEFERDYWELEKGADVVIQQLGTEKRAWQTLIQAQKLAATNNPQQLAAAIPLALQVPSTTHAATAARADLKEWSQKLLALGEQKWRKGDRMGAINTLKLDPKIARTPEIADLYQFSHAYRLANSALSEYWLPSVSGLYRMREAIAAIAQVKSDSPFYDQAQALRKNWSAQLADLTQLKYASVAAGMGNSTAMKLAVGQAQQIPVGQPRRVQAQSLMVFWSQELERLEDQPIVNQALRLAKPGSVGALQAAIAEASKIELNRALRGRAQTLIATWRSQIQALEDRPKLNQARLLAQDGKLDQAIAMASTIQAGRSLYREAQGAIADWQYQQVVNAQIAQDQPILDRANALADSGQLAAAIDTADRIGAGRALYNQAQSAINRWETQLNPPAPAPVSEPFQPGFSSDDQPEPEPSPNFWSPVPEPPLPRETPYIAPGTATGSSTSPSPSPAPSSSFPSPEPQLPREIQTVPPAATYEPYVPASPQPTPAPTLVPPAYEPVPPADPLPPALRDPLPPSP
jgi:uncharacterized protein (UPF0548 family)